MQANLTTIRRRWSNAQPSKTITFWIAIGAIILAVALGFTRGGWVTGGTASRTADLTAQTAVTERLAPICVAQSGQDAQKDQKLVELQALTSSNQRATYVKEQGWATMPGEAKPDDKVASECAKQLILIGE